MNWESITEHKPSEHKPFKKFFFPPNLGVAAAKERSLYQFSLPKLWDIFAEFLQEFGDQRKSSLLHPNSQ